MDVPTIKVRVMDSFIHNLTSQQNAQNKCEGCVEKTLSAFKVTAKVDFIDSLVVSGLEGTKYEGVEKGVLVWICDELRKIPLEKSRHAALAWRTMRWACHIDPIGCCVVKKSILNEDDLEEAFQLRFGCTLDGKTSETLKDCTFVSGARY